MAVGDLAFYTLYLWCIIAPVQGNLKEESVVAAILLSRMEASYRTAGFFRS